MRKIREIALVAATAVLLMVCPVDMSSVSSGQINTGYTVYAAESSKALTAIPVNKTGWKVEKGKRYYYIKGKKVKNRLITIKEKAAGKYFNNVYYLGADGSAFSGLKRIGGNLYYFDKTSKRFPCAAISGWKTVSNRKYYFLGNKKAAKGIVTIGSKKYCFGPTNNVLQSGLKKTKAGYMLFAKGSGVAVTNKIENDMYFNGNGYAIKNSFCTYNGNRYYISSNYKVKKGLFTVSGGKYYADQRGRLLKNTSKIIGNKTYYFGSAYKAVTGPIRIGKNLYLFDKNGSMKKNVWYQTKNGRYYFGANGRALTGYHRINGYLYYFKENCMMARNTMRITGSKNTRYYFAADGKAVTGLKKIGKSYYYFAKNSKAVTGFRKIGKLYYYFGTDGKAVTGVRKIGKVTYNFGSKGYAVGGVKKINGKTYLFDESGRLKKKGGWYTSKSGNKYCILANGTLAIGYKEFASGIYYFGKDGRMYKNRWAYANGYKFYFGKDGKRLTDVHNVLGVQSTYEIKVNKTTNVVTVYACDGDNGFIIPVKAFVCSGGDTTPIGTFYTPMKGRWWTLMGPCYGQWDTLITGDILFHSVYYDSEDPTTLSVSAYNMLGTTCSHGCIRLKAGDAKWIYDYCELGTKVTIFESEKDGPFPKPTSVQLESWHSWDPTDPTMAYKCKELGCHQGIAW